MEGIPAALFGGPAEFQSEQRRFRDLADAVRPAGKFCIIQQQNTDNFPEAECHNRQIIPPQPQHRKAEQQTGQRRNNPGQRQALPEPPAEIVIHQSVGVCPDGIKPGVAQYQQARQPDDHIQPEAEHHIDKG